MPGAPSGREAVVCSFPAVSGWGSVFGPGLFYFLASPGYLRDLS